MSESKVVRFSRYRIHVKFQKDKEDCDCRNTITTAGAYCNEPLPSPYWKNVKDDSEGLGLFLVLE
jgi:hypothetical protein